LLVYCRAGSTCNLFLFLLILQRRAPQFCSYTILNCFMKKSVKSMILLASTTCSSPTVVGFEG
jgi:hypothetical protein